MKCNNYYGGIIIMTQYQAITLDQSEKKVTKCIRIQPSLIKCLKLDAINQNTTYAQVLQNILYQYYNNEKN